MLIEPMPMDENSLERIIPEYADDDKNALMEQRYQELLAAMDKLDEVERSRQEAWEQLQKSKKRFLNMTKYASLILVMCLIVNFHQEMGQVGWNCIQSVSAIFNFYPQEFCGLLLTLTAAWLLLIVAKWTFAAAADDLFGGDDDDLSDR